MGLAGRLAVAWGVLTALVGPSLADPIEGECNPNRVKYKVLSSTVQLEDTATTFVGMPDGMVTIKVGGTKPRCVIVTLTATAAARGALIAVGARIPGTRRAVPNSVTLLSSSGIDTAASAHSAQFVFPDVPRGERTVEILYQAQMPRGGTAALIAPVITVQYTE